ncbi:MAG: SDR family NAD(P)-dependent oxidoreductase [Bacteroidales bacterium]|nr:SDR family NAD(P)-dependent oxidoreductase [Bacteroidales bacterium]
MPAVIVIGASSGLGRLIALNYLQRGYRVGVAARRVERLDHIVAQAPDRVVACRIDVTSADAAASLAGLIDRLGVHPDIFINCAGIGYANPELRPEADLATVETNCVGFTRITDFIFNYYAQSGLPGQIAHISSVAGTRGIGIAASYSASKRFQSEYLTALSQLARQRHLPIAITDLRPGFIDTPLLDSSNRYPMLMTAERASRLIVRAIDRKRHSRVIDRRWAVVTALWRRLPQWLWRRLPLHLSPKQ